MNFEQARAIARAGRRVRQVAWADRWLEFDRGLWFLRPVNPITRASGERHVVQTTDQSPDWWWAEWTTDELSPSTDIDALLTVYPWFEPLEIEFRGTIDGSDYIHIGGGQLWIVHRNWDPASDVEIRVNGGAWQPVESSPVALGIPTYGYDQFAFTPGTGRGSQVVDSPWSDDHAVILLDDDDPWSFPGADIYTFRATLSWSGTTSLEPYLPEPTSVLPGDYFAIVRCRWASDAGEDLDIGVSLLLPPATVGDGTSQIGYGWGGFYGPEGRPYLRWSGDSYSTGEREEDCGVDIAAIRDANAGLATFRLEVMANWWGAVGTGVVELRCEIYRGGELIQPTGGHFENPSGALVKSVERTVTLAGGGLLGYIDIKLATMSVAFAPA